MSAALGWALVAMAVAAGYMIYGWKGVVLALTIVAFWMLLQFSRAMRVLRIASTNPVGFVASAVMLHSRLRPGMRLPEVLVLTRALGTKLGEDAATASETWAWTDAGGDTVQIVLSHGRLQRWELQRAAPAAD